MSILLVGTDFSTRSDRALRRAVMLSHEGRDELLVVHVIDDDRPEEMVRAQRQAASTLLNETARTIVDIDRIPCRGEIRFGRVPEQMSETAETAGVTAMVLGPHRRAGLRDVFGEITAERIIRRSPVPVIVANSVPAAPYNRVLLATDCGEASGRAAEFLKQFRSVRPAEVDLLHLYEAEMREMLGRAMVSAEDRSEYLGECARSARKQLGTFAASVGYRDARLLVREAGGDAGNDIRRVAADENRDLIVLARSNKGWVEKALIGSVTKRVLETSEIDVLLVPEPK